MKGSVLRRVHKFTVGVPESLFAEGERERAQLGLNRSEYVALLYHARAQAIRREARIERYRKAYADVPSTPEEDSLTQNSMDVLAAEDA